MSIVLYTDTCVKRVKGAVKLSGYGRPTKYFNQKHNLIGIELELEHVCV